MFCSSSDKKLDTAQNNTIKMSDTFSAHTVQRTFCC